MELFIHFRFGVHRSAYLSTHLDAIGSIGNLSRGRDMCLSQMLLRCEGGDDFFEARIAAQRIPPREQLQIAIA